MKKWLSGLTPIERRVLFFSLAMMSISLVYFLSEKSPDSTLPSGSNVTNEGLEAPLGSDPPSESALVFEYLWRLSDLYSVSEQRLIRRDDRPTEVPIEIILKAPAEGDGPFFANISSNEDFAGELQRLESGSSEFKVLQARLGTNFWRFSRNGRTWSEAYAFTVQPKYLESTIELSQREISVALKGRREAVIRWRSGSAEAYIAEVSSTPEFETGKTEIKWLNEPLLRQGVNRPGRLFVRLRQINRRQEISDYSPVIQVVAR